MIDRGFSQRAGALALHQDSNGFAIAAARPAGYSRPWARAAASDEAAGPLTPIGARPAPRDATPSIEDLRPDD